MSNMLSLPAIIYGTGIVAVYAVVRLGGLIEEADSWGLAIWYALGVLAVVLLAALLISDLRTFAEGMQGMGG